MTCCNPALDAAACLQLGSAVTGFFRVDRESDVLLRCPNETACELGGEDALRSDCAPGYQGFLCSQCEPGYWQSQLTYNCYECDRDGADGWVVHGLVAAFMLLIILWLGRAFTRTIASRLNHETVPLVRIFLNMCHMLVILNGLPFSSEGSQIQRNITERLDYKTHFIMPFTVLADSACLGSDGYQSYQEQFEREIIGLSSLPFGIMLVSAAVLGPLEMFLREQDKARHWARNSFSYFNVGLFVAMPSILIGLLQAITCYDTVEGGKEDPITSHIKYHPELLCY